MHIHEHIHTCTKGHTYYKHTHTHINTDTLVDNTRLTVVQLNGPTLYGSISSQSFSQSLEKSIQGLGLDASSDGRFQLFARSSAKCASACNKCLRPFAPRQPWKGLSQSGLARSRLTRCLHPCLAHVLLTLMGSFKQIQRPDNTWEHTARTISC